MSALRNRSADEAGLQLSPSTRALTWALPRAFAAWLVLFQPLSVIAAVITVDSSGDGSSNDGQCTLTEAITNANDDAQTENDCPAGLGGDRIVLLNNVNLTTDKDPSDEETGLPRITSTIDIQGNGFTVARTASDFRFFHVESGGDLTLRNLTLNQGSQGTVSPPGVGRGGAIFNEGGGVRILDSTLSNNEVIATDSGSGGAIHSENGVLTLINCRVVDNTIDAPVAQGGGIYSSNDRLTLINSTVSGNTVRSDSLGAFDNYASGGGIATAGSVGTILLNRVTISGNAVEAAPAASVTNPLANAGGMLVFGDGTARLINTTISGNQVVSDGANGQATGGGLELSGNVSIEHSTIVGNSVSQTGGVFARGGGIYGGVAGPTITISASLFADNSAENDATTASESCSAGQIADNGANRADDATCSTIPSDLTAADLNFTLADNGGQVETHTLPSTSSAIGLATTCALRIDAREALRSDPACDSGAFEYGADDRFELSGEAATAPGDPDDQCFGHRFLIGKTENHLHPVDEDWVWFVGAAGATYEIETDDLVGTSDTVLELYDSCGDTFLTQDDDGGEGLASKITYPVTGEGDQFLDVRVLQADGYGTSPEGVSEGYDLAITCTANCPPCALPGGDVHEFTFETVMSFREMEACSRIQVLESLVASGGELHLRAGQVVELGDAFSVLDNGTLIVGTDPNLLPPGIVGPTE